MRISDWSSDVCSSDLWYTEILAPLTKAGGGTLYAAAPWERGLNRVKAKQAENADVYGALKLAEFPNAGTNPKVPDGSADVVLTFRNVHNWRFDGAEHTANAFQQNIAMLKDRKRVVKGKSG